VDGAHSKDSKGGHHMD